MVINVSCTCGKVHYLADNKAGRTTRCPSCGDAISVPLIRDPNAPVFPSSAANSYPAPFADPIDAVAEAVQKTRTPRTTRGPVPFSEPLMTLLLNPIDGQPEAMEGFGATRTMVVGLAMIAGFLAVFALVGISIWHQLFENYPQVDVVLRLLLGAAIPCCALLVTLMLIRVIFVGGFAIPSDIFCTGVIMQPWSVALIASSVLGPNNMEPVMLVGFSAAIMSVLLANAALVKAQHITSVKALFLTPALILLVFYLSKVILKVWSPVEDMMHWPF